MKIRPFLSFVPVLLFSCQSPTSQKAEQEKNLPQTGIVTPPAETSYPSSQYPDNVENTEYLEWSSVRINNRFPLVTTIENVESLLGKPDRIVKVDFDEICPSDLRSEDSKIVYYRGITFEQFGDSLDFMSIDFSKDKTLFLQSGSLRLDHSTTTDIIKIHFPKAMENFGKDGHQDIGLPPSKRLTDGQWVLKFEGDKLIGFDDWFPC